jgi:TonB-linked SusC/RagA family outer membrane protein
MRRTGMKRMAAGVWLVAGLLTASTTSAQTTGQQGVTGIVRDAQSQRPIGGAAVTVSGSGRGTLSAEDGRYTITGLPTGSYRVSARKLGFGSTNHSVVIPAGGLATADFGLTQSPTALDAVVVTGTTEGTQRRSLGNAVSSISTADLLDRTPPTSVTALLNGRAPGVTVVGGTGAVGAGPRINIRGQSSLSLNDQPLLYVDGIRVSNDVASGPKSQGYGSGVISRLNDFNPDDIESMEIIKGPAAATLYGTEASNGVIQIITKKGRGEGATWDFVTHQGVNSFRNAETRVPANYYKDASGQVQFQNIVAEEAARGTPIWQNGRTQDYTLSLSGTANRVSYYVAGNAAHNEGIDVTNYEKRTSGRVNLSTSPNPSSDIALSLSFARGSINLPDDIGNGALFNVMFGQPLGRNGPKRGFYSMPPEVFRLYENAQDVHRLTSSLRLTHRTTSWLTNQVALGFDQTDETNVTYRPYMTGTAVQFFSATSALGLRNVADQGTSYLTADVGSTARRTLTSSLTSATSVGAQLYRKEIRTLTANGSQFPAPDLSTVSAAAVRLGSELRGVNTTAGLYVQEQLGWNDRLFVTGAVRVDNNSAFGANFSLITYPKVNASWVVSEESFWHVPGVNSLKLRAAYGQTGQQPDNFAALRTYQAITTGAGTPGVSPQFVGNADLKPERGTEKEAGFEATALGERISLDFTAYNKRTSDAILLLGLAPSLGFPGSQYVNIGALENRGFELQLRTVPMDRPNARWTVDFGVARNDNKVLDLGSRGTIVVPSNMDTPAITLHHEVGLPAGSWFGKKIIEATVDAAGATQNIKCDRGTGGRAEGVAVDCASAQPIYLGRSDPRDVGSVASSLTLFGGFTVSAMLDFKLDVRHGDNDAVVRCSIFSTCKANFYPGEVPATTLAEYQHSDYAASYAAADASFKRLREIAVAYAVPARLLGGRAKAGTLTLAARNLRTWTPWTSLDPETAWVTNQFDKSNQTFTPQPTQLIAGLRVTF